MRKFEYACEVLLRNRYKKISGEIEATDKSAAKCQVFCMVAQQYIISAPLEFEKSIVVQEVDNA